MVLASTLPTRGELLAIKRRIRVAEQGHHALKMKRETLMLTLIRYIGLAKKLRRKIEADHRQARHTFAIAEMMEGFFGMAVAAISVEEVPEVQIRWRSDLRIRLPVYEGTSVRKDLGKRGYGLLGTSSVIDEAAEAYEGLVAALIDLATYEESIRLILSELERTSRRVNALEKRVIPELLATKDRIELRRDQLEREEFSRLFFIKKRKRKQEAVLQPEKG
jgi:V/A-type H+/Na+-transporting ATPase subunit D